MEWIVNSIMAAIWVGAAVWFFRYLRSERHGAKGSKAHGFRVIVGAAPWDAYGSPVGQAPPLLPESDPNSEIK